MSENNTAETNDSRSFEERVFLRFDAVDARLGSLDNRVEKLEMKQYDTKPIWEEVLRTISQTDSRVEALGNRVEQLDTKVGQLDTKVEQLDAKVEQLDAKVGQLDTKIEQTDAKVDELRSDMKSEFATLRNELDDSFHGVEWKIEALNENMLKLHANQRYAQRRLQDLESHTKPT